MQKQYYFLSILTLIFCSLSLATNAQKGERLLKGMYIQWGYNTEWYTKSDIHFRMANGDKFTLQNAKAHDKPDLAQIGKRPLEISIPQYNYRIGFYLNKNRTRSIELNFDHIKYVVTDGQKVKVTGTIDGIPVNGDSILSRNNFLHLEHTDGGNLLHINYVEQKVLKLNSSKERPLLNLIYKAGAGINIPRTDFTYRGDQLNNKFHIAGYNISAEAGLRYYPFKKIFIEGTGKAGFVNYLNALANTKSAVGNRVNHKFGYVELIGTVGVDIRF